MQGIDTTFDFRTDAGGKDPDSHSPTLRRYHQLLWSKRLPGGAMFDLDTVTPDGYLHHNSALGEYWLASDSIIPTFGGYLAMEPVLAAVPKPEIEEFRALGYTIAGMMVFPGNKVDGKQTLNGARGFNPRIRDRMDLTLECIRRRYAGDDPQGYPLGEVLARYGDFFGLFDDFEGYVRFFLLDDLVDENYAQVRFSCRSTTSPRRRCRTRWRPTVRIGMRVWRSFRRGTGGSTPLVRVCRGNGILIHDARRP